MFHVEHTNTSMTKRKEVKGSMFDIFEWILEDECKELVESGAIEQSAIAFEEWAELRKQEYEKATAERAAAADEE